ncbi:hypothetical protein CEE37_11180 [candidate division LCP-89 bacterium B3_LCP]|uniref:Transglutaminase-like domain-containing protein n=1 Tax=candidate division LCP-89 bacterium B3_LCP TaxID=2012998 RepID=A0A532UY52_UNCL8|nr:MAG: hypothetical protein CEE37_11180 [candidate division LCP-89 bacterium B3_LCP]
MRKTSGKICILLLTIQLVFSGFALAGDDENPAEVNATLELAGENRMELEKVIEHYSEQDDTLKLEAAFFLIANMEDHCFAIYSLQDSSGVEIELDVLDYPNFDSLLTHFRGVEEEVGELDFKKKEKIQDVETITAAFLIKQIDLAFHAWREKPWAHYLSFEQFCNYILPYRGSNEPLEPWRAFFLEQHKTISEQMNDASDPIEAASLINNDIRSWFRFDARYYMHPTDQGLSEMMDTKLGRCEDMTNLTIYALRANGLAVTSDYTPYWANTGNNHAWNSIVIPGGKVIPFMGAEANPREYRLGHKFGKIYRKMYAKQKGNLVFQDRKQEDVPRWLKGKNYIDVTKEYADVHDVPISFQSETPDSVDIAYICVFNSGEWKPIHWGRIKQNAATFTDMNPGVLYLPALYLNKEIVPYGPPFILCDDGSKRVLRPQSEEKISAEIASTTMRVLAVSTDGIAEKSLTEGTEYELFYWDEDWQSLGKTTAGEEALSFDEVPAGALYWLIETDSDEEERPFTIEDGKKVLW